MIKHKQNNIGGLLLAVKHRKAGKMEKDGKVIEWGECEQLVLLQFEGESDRDIRKYTIASAYQEAILKGLDEIHWGCLIELELEAGKVVSVNIIDDALRNFYETNV